MFDTTPAPRLFALPPGADFPGALAAGLISRIDRLPVAERTLGLARLQVIFNTRGMQNQLTAALSQTGARLLPRMGVLADLGADAALPGLPPPAPALRRRLELARLIERLITAAPNLAPSGSAFDLADSLTALLDEMQGEGVAPEALADLDVGPHAAHWARSLAFLRLVADWTAPDREAPRDAEARQRVAVQALAARWQRDPPDHPVIVAGSTGSRGSTVLLMQAVAALPQGALVLPGFDFDMPDHAWQALEDGPPAEDHPQFRLHRLLRVLGARPGDVRPWSAGTAPAPARNRLIGLALRPAPVTDQWRNEGAGLTDLAAACAGAALIEAPDPRAEALAIALRLRRAAEDGQSAALVTPDRALARRVTAALDRWGIRPDDSAGRPLALSPPGRFLRQTAALLAGPVTAEALVAILKHPLAHSGAGRGTHLLLSRALERRLRRQGPPFPDPAALHAFAATQTTPGAAGWADWLAQCLIACGAGAGPAPVPLAELVARHRRLAEGLAGGAPPLGARDGDAGALWDEAAGKRACAAMEELAREAGHGGTMAPAAYAGLIGSLLAPHAVREAGATHPLIHIRGPREAREGGTGLVILGGLNEGTWPAPPSPDPWLNRPMRLAAGLLLPERRIGLAAHDFQQAAGAAEVILSRARRSAEAETVPARWLNRLVNLLGGLPAQGGPEALAAMRAAGDQWLALAVRLEGDWSPAATAPRPAPCPPVAARPRELPVTAIERLIRDPYAIYARHVLGLRKLDPLHQSADARQRGTVLHAVMERFVRDGGTERAALIAAAEAVLAAEVPWPAARRLWMTQLDRVAGDFLKWQSEQGGTPALLEKTGAAVLPAAAFRLTARPDRIDLLADGRLHILDYKTGTPPTPKVQAAFTRQLHLQAAMAERGGFALPGPVEVARITYVGLGGRFATQTTTLAPGETDQIWSDLERLITTYLKPDTGFAARRAPQRDTIEGDYDHLARFGEWERSDAPISVRVGDHG